MVPVALRPARDTTRPCLFWSDLDSDGTVLLCLDQWGAHEHPSLMSRDEATPGNGLLLFFRVDDFDMSLKRARALVSPDSKRSRTRTRILEHGSSRSGIRTDTTSRLVRSLRSSWGATSRRPNKRMQPTTGSRSRSAAWPRIEYWGSSDANS